MSKSCIQVNVMEEIACFESSCDMVMFKVFQFACKNILKKCDAACRLDSVTRYNRKI